VLQALEFLSFARNLAIFILVVTLGAFVAVLRG
jgi:hypothetical protein